ncbi:hypothetical protein SAMN05216387_101126 [Nitrosovibrio tenuis]|uniref:Uncharacterized protein n=1 Tax=Nitrosovibrio tenuis TaxID=1233 RepID=A0A1H7G418_9PROT|nr:hypothetical protein SAMN05216387_101126 [Nitrosovibrio tenuis]
MARGAPQSGDRAVEGRLDRITLTSNRIFLSFRSRPGTWHEGLRKAGIGQWRGASTVLHSLPIASFCPFGRAPERGTRGPAKRGSGSGGAPRPYYTHFQSHLFALSVAPRNVGRGAPQSGDRAVEGMPDRPVGGACIPLRGRIFLPKATAPPCAVAPRNVARGAPQSGDRAVEGMPDRPVGGACIPLRGRTFLRKATAPPCGRAPERGTRGPAKRGSGSGGNARPPCWGRLHPATGSHLPAEGNCSAVRGRALIRPVSC